MSNLIDSLNKFGFEALQRTNHPNNTENIVFSPYSAFVCVAMSNSLFKDQTRDEILKALQIHNQNLQIDEILQELRSLIRSEKCHNVLSSNRIWANEKLNFDPATFSPNEKILGIPIEKVGFPQPACGRINNEFNTATFGMISKVLDPSDLNPNSVIVLTNAIYFKSRWDKPFDITPESKDPQSMNFTLLDGTKVHATMLSSFERHLPYTENDDFQIVSIPYQNGKYDFTIILPKDSTKSGYDKLANLTYEKLNDELLSKLSDTKVDVKLPKFTFDTKFSLVETFKSLGMEKAFTTDAECVDPNVSYFVSDIIQKAKIVLDENGTQAAAATAAIMECGCCLNPPPVPKIFADHPFMYLLRNSKTKTVFFEGFVTNPTF